MTHCCVIKRIHTTLFFPFHIWIYSNLPSVFFFIFDRMLKLVTMSTIMIQTRSQDTITLILTDTVRDAQARLQPKLTITSVQWESLTMRALEVNLFLHFLWSVHTESSKHQPLLELYCDCHCQKKTAILIFYRFSCS